MKTEQGEIPALFSCREAWGWTMPRRGWCADSGTGGGLATLWGARLLLMVIRRGAGGERKAPCFSAGIFVPRGFFANYGPKGPGGT